MSFASTIIGTAERVPLPDVIIRAAIHRLCSHAPDPDCASLHPGYSCE
jgi:hypothetical protein